MKYSLEFILIEFVKECILINKSNQGYNLKGWKYINFDWHCYNNIKFSKGPFAVFNSVF